MRIHFFGRLGERIARKVEIALPGDVTNVAGLRVLLASSYPDAAAELAGTASRACVGDQIVSEDHAINSSDIVEFVPPLSGG